jgi:hypothetical protein
MKSYSISYYTSTDTTAILATEDDTGLEREQGDLHKDWA